MENPVNFSIPSYERLNAELFELHPNLELFLYWLSLWASMCWGHSVLQAPA